MEGNVLTALQYVLFLQKRFNAIFLGIITRLGYTGLSYEIVGENGDGDGENLSDCLEALCGFQNLQFYKTIGEGVDILGEVWGGTINKYLTTFPGMDSQQDAKTISQWVLLGDPSLKIGGYS